MLVNVAKQELNIIVMRSSESVNEYYHRLFKQWQQASTPKNQRVEKLKLILKSSIPALLLTLKHINLRDLLKLVRLIKNQKKKISNNFSKDSPRLIKIFCPQKSNRQANRNSAESSTTTLITSRNSTAAAASKDTRLNINNDNNGNNASIIIRFGAVSTKPQGWIGTWHSLEIFYLNCRVTTKSCCCAKRSARNTKDQGIKRMMHAIFCKPGD